MWQSVRRLWRDESGTSDVEYVMITALIVIPMFLVVPALIVAGNVWFFDRIHLWINLPFP